MDGVTEGVKVGGRLTKVLRFADDHGAILAVSQQVRERDGGRQTDRDKETKTERQGEPERDRQEKVKRRTDCQTDRRTPRQR